MNMIAWPICHERLITWKPSTAENKPTGAERVEEESFQMEADGKHLSEWNTEVPRGRGMQGRGAHSGASTPVEWRGNYFAFGILQIAQLGADRVLKVHGKRVKQDGSSQEVYAEVHTSMISVYKLEVSSFENTWHF